MYNKFPQGAKVVIDGAEHLPHGETNGRLRFLHLTTGDFYRCLQPDGSLALPTSDQFDDLLYSERAVVVSMADSSSSIRRYIDEAEWTVDQVDQLDPKARRMLEQCRLLDEAGVPMSDKAIAKFLDKHWDEEKIEKFGPHDKVRTIRYWMAKRGRRGRRRLKDMVRLTGQRLDDLSAPSIEVQLQWLIALRALKDGLIVKNARALLMVEIQLINSGGHPTLYAGDKPLKLCSEATLRRRMNALRSDDTLPSIIEKEAREQDWLGAGASLEADYVMQRVIIDHTIFDMKVVDTNFSVVLGRAWLTIAIDVKSRAIVAYLITFFDPRSWTVGQILRRMVLPKRPPPKMAERYPILTKIRGKPGELIVDNAAEFRSHTMEAAARNIGFSVRFCPIGKPRYRAICERAIGTLNRMITREMLGRTLPIRDARRFGYDADDHACVMLNELEAVTNQLVAEYNVTPHEGIRNLQPALVFEKDMRAHGINNVADLRSFMLDTMDVVQNAQLTPSGIRAFGDLRYHHIQRVPSLLNDLSALEPRRQLRDDATATVDYRYDPTDISKIYVWNRKTRQYVELHCSCPEYAEGMPIWLHDEIRKAAAAESAAFNTEEERLLARGRLLTAIKSISPSASAASRKRLAELLEIPRIRQITGNLVHVLEAEPESVSLDEFIANDRAAMSSLDHEILSGRPALSPKEATKNLRRRQQEAQEAHAQLGNPKKRRTITAKKGGYN